MKQNIPFGMLGPVGAPPSNEVAERFSNKGYKNLETDEDGFTEMTEDDFYLLSQALGG